MWANYYPKNFRANGWGWHRGSSRAAAVRGFLDGERGGGEGGSTKGSSEPLIGGLYPKLPSQDDSDFNGVKLYPALPAEEYESGAVEEVIEEDCAAVNINLVVSIFFCLCFFRPVAYRLSLILCTVINSRGIEFKTYANLKLFL